MAFNFGGVIKNVAKGIPGAVGGIGTSAVLNSLGPIGALPGTLLSAWNAASSTTPHVEPALDALEGTSVGDFIDPIREGIDSLPNPFHDDPPPPVPDLPGAEKVKAEEEKKLVDLQNLENRPHVNADDYEISWDRGPDGRPIMNLKRTGDAAAAHASGNRLKAGLLAGAEQQMPGAIADLQRGMDWNSLQQVKPFDFGSAPAVSSGADARRRAEDAIYRQAQSRLDPMWNEREAAHKVELINQGFDPQSEAYRNLMFDFGRQRNDAYQTAMNNAITGGGVEGQRDFNMDLMRRNQAVNEGKSLFDMQDHLRSRGIAEGHQRQYGAYNALNAMRQGTTVAAPEMPSFNFASRSNPADVSGALATEAGLKNEQYGIQQGQKQSKMDGITDLASLLPLLALL